MIAPTLDEVSAVAQSGQYLGLARLMRLSTTGVNLQPLCQLLIQRATQNADDAIALMDASIIFQFYGDTALALQLQAEALKLQRLYCHPAERSTRLRVLALLAPGDLTANVPIECLLEHSDVELNLFYTTGAPAYLEEIPEHDVLFVAIGESTANMPILAAWQPLLAQWPRPVLNNPEHIGRIARDVLPQFLGGQSSIAMPPSYRLPIQSVLSTLACLPPGLQYPLLVRPVDSHAGHDLYKVADAAELQLRLAAMPGEEVYMSPFMEYSNEDGQYRKYRVFLIDGQPYACHMAISSHWMIHYLNAGMADSADKRAEEAQFMAHFEQDFAVRHREALAAIERGIGLDYLGIDCAEMPDGRLLVFEVGHAMVAHDMDPVELYPYKQPNMQKFFAAFRSMLYRAAGLDA